MWPQFSNGLSKSTNGAGSVVVHDIPDNYVAAGNPCRVIKTIE